MLMTRSPSFVAEGGDGIQAAHLAGGPYAEHDADQQARDDRGSEGRRGECERPAGDARDKRGGAESEGDAEQAAQQREGECLDEELGEDVGPSRADGLADADLAGP